MLSDPINDIKAVTPNDTTDLPDGTCRALIFTGTGDVIITTAAGNDVTLPVSPNWFGVQPIRAKRIKKTGTTATGIFACY